MTLTNSYINTDGILFRKWFTWIVTIRYCGTEFIHEIQKVENQLHIL